MCTPFLFLICLLSIYFRDPAIKPRRVEEVFPALQFIEYHFVTIRSKAALL